MGAKISAAQAFFAKFAAVCPATHDDANEVITVVWDQRQIGKRFIEQADGSIKKESTATICHGVACQVYVPDHETLEKVLTLVSQSQHAAIVNAGFNPVSVGESFYFLSRRKLKEIGLDDEAVTTVDGLPAFARLKIHSRPSKWQLLDRDEDQYTPAWAKDLDFASWRSKLELILPGISKVKMLRAHSSSARVLRIDGSPVGGGNGHVWVKVENAEDVERTRTAIMAGAIERGISWAKPKYSKATGEVVAHSDATIIDHSVLTLGRLVFSGMPVCVGNLIVIPQKFEIIAGELDELDTSLATFSPIKVFRITAKKGAPVRIKRSAKGFNVIEENLSLDTALELEDGTLTTVESLMEEYAGKVRCQAPFRESESVAAFFAIDDYGRPFVFDSGTNTLHVLPKRNNALSDDPQRTALIEEYQRWIGNLIGDENVVAVLDTSVLETAWDATCYDPTSGKFVLLNHGDELISLSGKDFESFGFARTFGQILYTDMLDEAIDELPLNDNDKNKLRERLQAYRFTPFIERMKLYRQAKSMNIVVDMFANRGALSVTDGIASVALPHKPFAVPSAVTAETVTTVVEDYTKHFTEFHEFLGLVLHARFATDRRHAFIWLHSLSSWGKGFLLAIFDALGLVVEIAPAEIEKAIAGGPVGVSMNDMLRTWILFVDEFKAASSELKLLNRQIAISPKHQLRCTVQLYVKLFASAENVRSLVGAGVEGQFNNRFAYLSPSTREQKLEDREIFRKLGKAVYMGALVSFVADYLNGGVRLLCAMGKIEASKVADAHIEQYQQARTLQVHYGTLEDMVDELVDQIRRSLISYGEHYDPACGMPPTLPEVAGLGQRLVQTLQRTATIGLVSEGSGSKHRRKALVLGQPAEFVKSYVALSGDSSTVGKLQYKADLIVSKLHMRSGSAQDKVRVYALPDKSRFSDIGKKAARGTPSVAEAREIANKRGLVIFLDLGGDG